MPIFLLVRKSLSIPLPGVPHLSKCCGHGPLALRVRCREERVPVDSGSGGGGRERSGAAAESGGRTGQLLYGRDAGRDSAVARHQARGKAPNAVWAGGENYVFVKVLQLLPSPASFSGKISVT